jgi:hypothetical protein
VANQADGQDQRQQHHVGFAQNAQSTQNTCHSQQRIAPLVSFQSDDKDIEGQCHQEGQHNFCQRLADKQERDGVDSVEKCGKQPTARVSQTRNQTVHQRRDYYIEYRLSHRNRKAGVIRA